MTGAGLFGLAGKVAVVTGGAGILGRRFCLGLAGFGARVAVIDIDGEAAGAVAAEIEADHPGGAIAIGCDVADPADVAAMTESVVTEFGRIDVLHNNAATKTDDLEAFLQPFEEYSLDTWREVMAVNIDAMFVVAQSIGRVMVIQGKGSIIQTSSIYGIMGPDQRIYEGSEYQGRAINTPAVYSVSKAAVVGLTRHLATYWAGAGIRVNTLTPGGVESGQNATFRRRYAERIPLGRMGEADELVGALVYLASDASSYVTGQNLVVDGGLSAW